MKRIREIWDQYIGMGAFYFADFKLFHKQLGIHNMISIEGDPDIRKRVYFNRPFSCVKIKPGRSTKILRKHTWNCPTIIWLDYDSVLHRDHLQDIQIVVENCQPGSVLIITSDTDPKALDHGIPDVTKDNLNDVLDSVSQIYEKHGEDASAVLQLLRESGAGDIRLAALEKRLDEKVPLGVKEDNLSAEDMPKVIRDVIHEEIKRRLRARNRGIPRGRQLEFVQLYNFRYADGRQMHTYGGIFVTPAQKESLRTSGMLQLKFIRSGDDFYEIKVPGLTVKELKFLEAFVPRGAGRRKPRRFEIRQDEFVQYCEAYRYYPIYAEFDF